MTLPWAPFPLAISFGRPQDIMLLLGVVIIIVVLLRLPRVRQKKKKALEQRQQVPRERPEGKLRHTMEELLVELHEMSREMNARIDTKMHAMEALLRRADEMCDRLEALSVPGEGGVTTSGECEKYAEIYALADEGASAEEIARLKGRSPGEIELIINLRRRS